MSTRVSLEFRSNPDALCSNTRVVARASFLLPDREWDRKSHPAIIDTGAPMCVFPRFLWRRVKLHLIRRDVTVSLAGKIFPADVGWVRLRLVDNEARSPGLAVPGYLCHENDVPLLLGFEGVLTHGVLHCDYPSGRAAMSFD